MGFLLSSSVNESSINIFALQRLALAQDGVLFITDSSEAGIVLEKEPHGGYETPDCMLPVEVRLENASCIKVGVPTPRNPKCALAQNLTSDQHSFDGRYLGRLSEIGETQKTGTSSQAVRETRIGYVSYLHHVVVGCAIRLASETNVCSSRHRRLSKRKCK